jgi:hypothetical protein
MRALGKVVAERDIVSGGISARAGAEVWGEGGFSVVGQLPLIAGGDGITDGLGMGIDDPCVAETAPDSGG